ncbi:MAG: hypothetical protein JOY78_20605 [Pseudonocardia sp.]|nr:hypothetical protein [Pseudonocardia sp.]
MSGNECWSTRSRVADHPAERPARLGPARPRTRLHDPLDALAAQALDRGGEGHGHVRHVAQAPGRHHRLQRRRGALPRGGRGRVRRVADDDVDDAALRAEVSDLLSRFIAGVVLFSNEVANQVGLGPSDSQFLGLLGLEGPLTPAGRPSSPNRDRRARPPGARRLRAPEAGRAGNGQRRDGEGRSTGRRRLGMTSGGGADSVSWPSCGRSGLRRCERTHPKARQ